jgi:hypothetical protein
MSYDLQKGIHAWANHCLKHFSLKLFGIRNNPNSFYRLGDDTSGPLAKPIGHIGGPWKQIMPSRLLSPNKSSRRPGPLIEKIEDSPSNISSLWVYQLQVLSLILHAAELDRSCWSKELVFEFPDFAC